MATLTPLLTNQPSVTPTATAAPPGGLSALNARLVVDFGGFLKNANIFGFAVSYLIAQATIDVTRSISSGAIMPLVRSIRTLKSPTFDFNALLENGISFVIIMALSFVIIRVARLQTQNVPIVMPLQRI